MHMRQLFLVLTLLFAPVLATAEEVALELVLLADTSGSIEPEEVQFQREGYAQALSSQEVLNAIETTLHGVIAVTYVEWAGLGSVDVVVPWARISNAQEAQDFVADLRAAPRKAFGRNAIGYALLKGKELIETNEFESFRKVIDFSGDSVNNYRGPAIAPSRDEVLAAGITINALALSCRFCGVNAGRAGLAESYRQQIIGGPGAFVVEARTDEDFAASVKRKLILEIAGPDRIDPQLAATQPGPSILVANR